MTKFDNDVCPFLVQTNQQIALLLSERQATSMNLEVSPHSKIGSTCNDVKKEHGNMPQFGDCEQIINAHSSQMRECIHNLESHLTSKEVAHSDNDCKCDQDSQMLENIGCSLSVAGGDGMHHQPVAEDKSFCAEISKHDSESNNRHTITVNASTNKFEWLGLHTHLVGTSPEITSDSTESKLHSCQITCENRD